MKEFMLIFRNEKKAGEAPSIEQMKAMMMQWQKWIRQIVESGKFVGTNRLLPEGKTIHPDNEIKDGPYVEAKEIVGGYVIIKARTLNDATEIAKSCPVLLNQGKVEIREVMSIETDAKSENFLGQK